MENIYYFDGSIAVKAEQVRTKKLKLLKSYNDVLIDNFINDILIHECNYYFITNLKVHVYTKYKIKYCINNAIADPSYKPCSLSLQFRHDKNISVPENNILKTINDLKNIETNQYKKYQQISNSDVKYIIAYLQGLLAEYKGNKEYWYNNIFIHTTIDIISNIDFLYTPYTIKNLDFRKEAITLPIL